MALSSLPAKKSSPLGSSTPQACLDTFVAKAPKSRYTLQGSKETPQSEVCREGEGNVRECLVLQMHCTEMFEAMQKHGFYCALPMDPRQTHIECVPISK
ncbi:hypothetical protein BDN72DRAFT_403854 [Pluteus cervinus]|uniref:Uncharacterized protein n=1 Tax=Pluteus cervinus TaxID=181527 RepID=A0ACD3A8J9_9AGAR|nr:hypothetical protein BDN72DRAFT_403854 [Pluteus cervinus]